MPTRNWFDNPMPWTPNTKGAGTLGPTGPGKEPWLTPEWMNMSISERQKAASEYNAASSNANPRDDWNIADWARRMTGENTAMFDNEIMSRFMSMPRYDANEERRGIESGINRTIGDMGSVQSVMRGLTSDGSIPTQENKIMNAMQPIAQARVGAESELYAKQRQADQSWLENLLALITQRQNIGQQGWGNFQQVLDRIYGLQAND